MSSDARYAGGFSIGETSSLIYKAYRGIGRPWGLAEEAGRAAGWLSARGLPAPEMFAHLVQRFDGIPSHDCTPASLAGTWMAPGGILCPVIAGTALCDAPDSVRQSGGVTMKNVAAPLILIAFAATVARKTGLTLAIEWPGMKALCAPDGYRLEADETALTAEIAPDLTITSAETVGTCSGPSRSRVICPGPVIAVLDRFAHRTYVPETEQSRLTGAGAGLTDND